MTHRIALLYYGGFNNIALRHTCLRRS